MFQGRIPKLALPLFTLVLSSALAGVATAPFSAAHFNRIADLGFAANLLTVPVMGAVVMPAGALAALLAPLGLEGMPLWVMGQGSAWILAVAREVAAIEGAVTAVPAPGPWVLPLLTLGALWLAVWRGWLRLAGLVPVALALLIWSQVERPHLLISPDGTLAGLAGPTGRALSSARGAGFTAESWLENDGDLADQPTAAGRPGFSGPPAARQFTLGGWRGIVLKGTAAPQALPAACAQADLVILGARAEAVPPGCIVIDTALLRQTGGLALRLTPEGGLAPTATRQAQRLWHRGNVEPVALPAFTKPGPERLARR